MFVISYCSIILDMIFCRNRVSYDQVYLIGKFCIVCDMMNITHRQKIGLILILTPIVITLTFGIVYSNPPMKIAVKSALQHIPSDDTSVKIYLAILAAVITVFIGPRFAAHFKRREQYFIPFTEWCIRAYGTINEFLELYKEITRNVPTPASRRTVLAHFMTSNPLEGYNNPTYVITHFLDMHKEVEHGYKVLGIIKKYDPTAAKRLDDCFDKIDKLWHYLEQKYPVLTMPPTTDYERRELLNNLTTLGKEEIATDIIITITNYPPNNDKSTILDELKAIKKLLKKRIPGTLF